MNMVNSGKNVLGGEGADVGVVGKKGMLEWGNIPDKMPMDTEKVTFNSLRTNGVDSRHTTTKIDNLPCLC